MPKITIYVPDEEPLKIGFDDQIEVNIGRSEDNDIVIDHDSISSHHAQLKLHGNRYHLIDLDSTNGTFVDGGIASNIPLHDGAKIVFGQVDADYESEEEEEAGGGEGDSDGQFASESEGSGFENTIHAEIAETSVAPATFKNLSPIEKVEKKDVFSQIAMAVCVVAILASAGVAIVAAMMKIP